MFYEVRIALKTIRQEGFKSFLDKLKVYVSDLKSTAGFFASARATEDPEDILHFIYEAGNGLVAPAQVRSELASLMKWMRRRKPAQTVLEIGTARGGTLFCWCALAAEDATVISVDLPQGIHGGGYPYWKSFIYGCFKKRRQRLHLLRGDSHSARMRARVSAILAGRRLDVLFIDGDHTLTGVHFDYRTYAPMVRPGGIIIFHDICLHPADMNCHVAEYWNGLKAGRRWLEFVENPNQGAFGIGVLLADDQA